MEPMAITIRDARQMLAMSKSTFYAKRPVLVAHGMKQVGELIDLKSLRAAWAAMVREATRKE